MLDSETKLNVHKARSYRIVVSNDLIQDGTFPELTPMEFKVFFFMLSLIKPQQVISDAQPLEYMFEVSFLCDVLGICSYSGKNYKRIKQAVKNLRDKSVWMDVGESKQVSVSILNKVWVNNSSGRIRFRFDEDMAPYIFSLSNCTTRTELNYILSMNSSYSFLFYLICRSYARIKTITFSYAELRKKLMVHDGMYSRFTDFEKRVLSVAVREINRYSDINVEYRVVRRGYSAEAVIFTFSEKMELEKYAIMIDSNKKLDLAVMLNHERNSIDRPDNEWSEME